MRVQALFTQPAVERFDRGVVRRLAAAAEVQDDAARATTADLVIDGALGTAFLMRGPVTLDLRDRLYAP